MGDQVGLELEQRAWLSRRTFLGAGTATAALFAIGVDPFALRALADTTQWNHPFPVRRSIPSDGEFLNNASFRNGNLHSGVDLSGGGIAGQPIYNCAAGTVIHAADTSSSWGSWVGVEHPNGQRTGYAHMQPGTIAVSVGDVLSGPTVLGAVGGSGAEGPNTYGAHLHLARWVGPNPNSAANWVDPTFLAFAALVGSSGLEPTNSTLGEDDDMTDMLYYATGASYTTNGVKTPAVTVTAASVWYQERPGAPLFRVTDNYNGSNLQYQGNLEYVAFLGARFSNAAAARTPATTTEIGKLIELRGETLQPSASLAPLRT